MYEDAASQTLSLNAGWLFGGSSPGSSQPRFDDRDFAAVTLPHCVTPLGWREWNPMSWAKTWVYRQHFDAPASASRMRTFIDFNGALTTTRPTFNGHALPEHLGGYLPFTYELTEYLCPRDNVLAVELDATWQNVPPEGSPSGAPAVDYLEPGGLYRDASLRMVPQVFIADLFAKPVNVLDPASRQVQVECTIDSALTPSTSVQLDVVLLDAGRLVDQASVPVKIDRPGQVTAELTLDKLGNVTLWDVDSPHLYDVVATLTVNRQPVHDCTRRIGFREARFETDGFFLNGNRLKIFGLNRHQVFPYTGMSMPARIQRRDALILKQELNCNMVRCSHYPQSQHFLDACDELGIMVWEETPGCWYLGDATFQDLVVQNVHDMIVRDRNRPAIVIWGVQVNESPRDLNLYTRTRDLAYSLDGSRQTSGSSVSHELADYVQDVFAYDDYSNSQGNATLAPPLAGIPYLVSESVGAVSGPPGFRRIDTQAIQQTQARLHAQVHNTAGSDNAYCGLLGWCGFDYDSLTGNTYQSLKWPGVVDTFRILKPGAAFYQSQVSPNVHPVIQPAFYWDFGTTSPVTTLGTTAMVWSNCDRLEAYVNGAHYASLAADFTGYPNLNYPPFYLDTTGIDGSTKPELRLDGYVANKLVLSRWFAGDPDGDYLEVWVDDAELVADGSDTTRVAFRAVDCHGAPRTYADGHVSITVDGPGTYVGEVVSLVVESIPELILPGQQATVSATLTNAAFPFSDNGGAGAIYIRTLPGSSGNITVTATHPTLGSGSVRIRSRSPQTTDELNPGTMPPRTSPSQVLTDASVSVDTPTGWTVQALSKPTRSIVAPGSAIRYQWRVTAPESVAPGAPTTLTASAMYNIRGEATGTHRPVPVYLATTVQEAYNITGISDDSHPSDADFDGIGTSYSEQALSASGLAPGAVIMHDGVAFTWPKTSPGQPDAMLAQGRTVLLSGKGGTLGFLGTSTFATGVCRGKVFYTDGTDGDFSFMLDQNTALPGPENDVIAKMAYFNTSSDQAHGHMYIFYVGVPLESGNTVKAVTLLDGGFVAPDGLARGARVFAIGIGA